jgi:hypothetical protein
LDLHCTFIPVTVQDSAHLANRELLPEVGVLANSAGMSGLQLKSEPDLDCAGSFETIASFYAQKCPAGAAGQLMKFPQVMHVEKAVEKRPV